MAAVWGVREGIDVSLVEVGRPGNVIDVGLKGQCAVKDDTQTLKRFLY